MCKPAVLAFARAALTAGCAPRPRVESRIRVAIDGSAPVDVRLSLSAERAAQQARWTEAIAAAVRHHVRVLGSASARPFTVSDRRVAAVSADAIDVAAPLWSSHRGIAIEAAVAEAVARLFWRRALPCAGDRAWLVDGLARYTALASLAAQNEGAPTPSVGASEGRYAGGFLPWVLRASVPAGTSGDGVAFRPRAPVAPSSAMTPLDREAGEARTALAMQTLLIWIGSPTWEAVLRALVDRAAGRCGSPPDLQAAALDVTGLDLSWFLGDALTSARTYDYAIDGLVTRAVPGAAGRYRTEVVAARRGDAVFSGSNALPVGPFESGRGVEIAVQFSDGSTKLDYWDGRARSRRFEYQSASPAVSATIDPRGVILLDASRTNNSRTLAPRAATAATQWAVRWTAWVEHLLLTWASLV